MSTMILHGINKFPHSCTKSKPSSYLEKKNSKQLHKIGAFTSYSDTDGITMSGELVYSKPTT
jgi:hypothetical protein